jgi:DNA-binding MarR family transcriptional regulator
MNSASRRGAGQSPDSDDLPPPDPVRVATHTFRAVDELAVRAILRDTELISAAKCLLVLLAIETHYGAIPCTIRHRVLSDRLDLSREMLQRHFSRLRKKGWVIMTPTQDECGGRRANEYRMGPRFKAAVQAERQREGSGQ